MSDEDEMEWDEVDPFSHLGYVRIIVVRHTPQTNWKGELDNCTYIAAIDGFYLGFQCNPIEKKWNLNGVLPTYKEDVELCEHKINHVFRNKPNGIYELVGEMWAWSSTSYEGEWDGDTEVRNFKIQQISFNDAIRQCEIGEGLYTELCRLKPTKKDQEYDEVYRDEVDVHHYMTKKQILENHANVLARIVEGTYHSRTSFKDSTPEELETCIHMMMLQIDSEKHLEQHRQFVLEVDQKVKNVMQDHEHLMAAEE